MSLNQKFRALLSKRPPETWNGDAFVTAAKEGDLETLKFSLKKFNRQLIDVYGDDALEHSIMNGHTACALALLQAGVSVEGKENSTVSPLMWAANHNRVEVIKELIARKAQLERRQSTNGTALHIAADKGCAESVAALIAGGAEIDALGNHDSTPLANAVANKHIAVVNLLIAAKANINHQNLSLHTPLMLAVHYRSHDAITALLAAEADVTLINKPEGATALHMAHDCISVNALLSAKASTTARDDTGRTPLAAAAAKLRTEAVSALLAHGTQEIDTVDAMGDTPLTLAARQRLADVTQVLIAHQADLNKQNILGNSALMCAVDACRIDSVKALLEAGADLALTNESGETALDIARRNGLSGVRRDVWELMETAEEKRRLKIEREINQFSSGTKQSIVVAGNLKLQRPSAKYKHGGAHT